MGAWTGRRARSACQVRTRARRTKVPILLWARLAVGRRCWGPRRDTGRRRHHLALMRLRVAHVGHTRGLGTRRAMRAARCGGRRALVRVVLTLRELLESFLRGVHALRAPLHALHALHPAHALHTLHLHAAHATHTLHSLPGKPFLRLSGLRTLSLAHPLHLQHLDLHDMFITLSGREVRELGKLRWM